MSFIGNCQCASLAKNIIMAENKTRRVIILETNCEIEVYRTLRGTWCCVVDCKTEYTDEQVKVLDK